MSKEKNFDLMKNITKSASMTESTIAKNSVGGRPKVENKQNKKATVNFTDEEFEKIEELCQSRRLSKSQLIKTILSESGII